MYTHEKEADNFKNRFSSHRTVQFIIFIYLLVFLLLSFSVGVANDTSGAILKSISSGRDELNVFVNSCSPCVAYSRLENEHSSSVSVWCYCLDIYI